MQVVADRIDEFDVKLICQIMVGLAHLGPPADARLLAAVVKRSTDLLDTFSPQVALLCWPPCSVVSTGTSGSLLQLLTYENYTKDHHSSVGVMDASIPHPGSCRVWAT